MAVSTAQLLLPGVAVRLVLLVFGLWQDANMSVKYTDIDYEVVTDGAQFMAGGGSPYERSTYRYSPLLAAAMLPNILVHKAAGKVLFCAADLAAARLFQALLSRDRVPANLQATCVALWLFNPLSITISTRGSGEAVVACMLLALLLLLRQGRPAAAGAMFGLAVHYRLYPIIYAWPILLQLGSEPPSRNSPAQTDGEYPKGGRNGGSGGSSSSSSSTAAAPSASARLLSVFSVQGLVFGLAAASVFLGLGALFYWLYGYTFLHETYLYHASRVDPRHNFSPFFYPAYLASVGGGHVPMRAVNGAFTVAQAVLQLCLGWRFSGDLPFCLLLQTMVLVAFNKVCTAQYFVWYLTFLPLVVPQLLGAKNKGRLVASMAAWVAAMAHWLFWAYLLEFQGLPLYLAVWGASLVFLAAHVWLIIELVRAKATLQPRPGPPTVDKVKLR